MPDATALDRANREQLARSAEWRAGLVPDTTVLRGLIAELPDSSDRRMFQSWIAQVEASDRHRRGDRAWLRPLAEVRDLTPRPPLPHRWTARLWLSRFAAVAGFITSALVFSAVALSISSRGEQPPPSYAQTELATRGDLPRFDADRVWRTLPRLERALSSATRAGSEPLSSDAFDGLIVDGMPTLIWTVGHIDVAPPPDAAAQRVWEVEVLLGGFGPTANTAIVTFRSASGPSYRYMIDAGVIRALRQAAGLPVGPAPS
jgi:hypothetical protein